MLRKLLVCYIMLLATCTASRAAGKISHDNDKERDVYRVRLDAEREVVVVQGFHLAPQVLRSPIWERSRTDQFSTVYAVRVELRSQGLSPLVLASRLVTEGISEEDKCFDVLDALVEPGRMTFAMAQGCDVFLWQLDPLTESPSALIGLGISRWSSFSAGYRRDRSNVSTHLGRSDDGKLTVEVVDRLPPNKEKHQKYQHTLFEQVEDAWRFKPVKQWWDAEDKKE